MSARRKKILFLHRSMRLSGATQQLATLIRELDRELWDVVLVIQQSDSMHPVSLPPWVRVIELSSRRMSHVILLFMLVRVIQKERPDVIQAFNRRSNWLAYSAALFTHEAPVIGSILSANLKAKWIFAEWLFKGRTSAVVVNSTTTALELREKARLSREQVKLIYIGVDTDRFSPTVSPSARIDLRASFGISRDDFVILSLGRIHRVKNLSCTLRAVHQFAKTHSSFRYYCVGPSNDDDLATALKTYARTNGLNEHAKFVDATDRSEMFYRIADVFVLSSWSESLSMVLLEAMSCGCIPLVAFSADDNQVIHDGTNGFRFAANDAEALGRLLDMVSSLSTDSRSAITKAARESVLSRFSIKKMVFEFQNLYLEKVRL